MTFPFPNPKPMGWAMFETLTSSQATQINANAARAADGALWSDLAASSIVSSVPLTSVGHVLGWDPASRYFYTFGANGTVPLGFRSRTGRRWLAVEFLTNNLNIGAGAQHSFAANGTGTIVVGGLDSGANNCFRRSVGGGTFGAFSSSSSSNNDVLGLRWVAFLSRFVAAFGNGAIETSPTGESWAAASISGGDANSRIGGIADNGSIAVMGSASGSGTNILSSTNGTLWTPRSTAGDVLAVAWSPAWGKFFAYGTEEVQSSADGITWSTSGLTFPAQFIAGTMTTIPIGVYGRLLYIAGTRADGVGALVCSHDGGATWLEVEEFAFDPARSMVVAPNGSMILTDDQGSDSNHYASLRFGT